MPADIQTNPLGLLSLLSLKNQGQNPQALGPVVMPTLDLIQAYATDQAIEASAYVNITAASAPISGIQLPNNPAALQVPSGKVWLLLDAQAAIFWSDTTANLVIQELAVSIYSNQSQATGFTHTITGPPAPPLTFAVVPTSAKFFRTPALRGPLWLPAGYRVGVQFTADFDTADVQLGVSIRYVELSV